MNMQNEPARIIGLVTAVAGSVLALAVGLGMPENLVAPILGVIAGVGPLVAAFVIRGKVYSPETVKELTNPPPPIHRQDLG